MAFKKSFAAFGISTLGCLVIACSSSSSPSQPAADSGTTVITHPDSGPAADTGVGPIGDSGTCSPADESGFTPPAWHQPHQAPTCDQAQLDSLFQCFNDLQNAAAGQTPASCGPWTGNAVSAANQACGQCVQTANTSATWGPIVVDTAHNTEFINFAGCIALVEGQPGGGGCGGALAASQACDDAACDTNCPVDAQGNGLDALNACVQTADTGTCNSFSTAANCANADSGPAVTCIDQNANDTFFDAAKIVAQIFCGGGDGAAPPGDQ